MNERTQIAFHNSLIAIKAATEDLDEEEYAEFLQHLVENMSQELEDSLENLS